MTALIVVLVSLWIWHTNQTAEEYRRLVETKASKSAFLAKMGAPRQVTLSSSGHDCLIFDVVPGRMDEVCFERQTGEFHTAGVIWICFN